MPLPEPNIAVLLAAYNGMQWIREQLDSIQAQQNVAVHIFISVDASTDGTGSWCEHYASQCTNVTLLPASEPCGGAAKNFFRLIRDVELERFELIALADQDDIWHEDKLHRAACYLAASNAHAYSSNVTAFWPDGTTRLLNKAQQQVRWDHYFEAAGPGCTYVLVNEFACFLQQRVRTDLQELQQVTLHDWYIYAIARTHGYTWYIDPVPGMSYRQHTNNQVGANIGVSALLARYHSIRSGWWFGQVQLIEKLAYARSPSVTRPEWRALQRSHLLRLCLEARHCRRRRRDQWLFGLLCFVTAVIRGPQR